MLQGKKVAGVLNEMIRKHGMECARALHEAILIPTLLYGSETLYLNGRAKERVNAVAMSNLRCAAGVSRIDRVRNEDVEYACGIEKGTIRRMNEKQLSWYGHVCRMNEVRMVKKIYVSECGGRRPRGRPRNNWMTGVKECLASRGKDVTWANAETRDRDRWRRFVKGE